MHKQVIYIKAVSLNTREAATELCKEIIELKAESVELDFTGVEFMSRSFADQFYKERQKLREENGISVFLINMEEEIERMLEAVGRTQNKKERTDKEIVVKRLNNMEDVSKYLGSIE